MARSVKERLEYCKKWDEKLNDQFSSLKEKRQKALLYRDADPSIVKIIENRSKITTTDMQDAIDMAKPDILETVAGIDEPLKLDPDEAKYVESTKKLQVLGNVMVKRKNKWFRICSDFLDDSMVLQFGVIKYRWVEDEIVTSKIYEDLTPEEIDGLLLKEGASLGENNIEDDGKHTIKINYKITDEYVRYDAVPSERIRFPLDTRDFAECPFVIEEVRLYEHEFLKMYGDKNLKKVKDAKEALSSSTPDPDFEKRFKHVGGLDGIYDKKADKYKSYECYFWEDDKPWMMTWIGDIVLQDEENKYGKPPYRGGSPFLISHSLIGKGYYDCLKSIQEERTFIKRQIFDVVVQNNFRRNFIDIEYTGLNIDDYENNSATNALIRCNSGGKIREGIFPEPKTPLGNDVINFWEMMAQEKDAHIPTPRAYTGIEGGKDERTYRGKQLKVNQASKKLLMMIRAYMEEVFGPLFQDTLDCIAKFMKKKTVVRYLNEDYPIDPNEIICKYALVVNVGLGSHDKEDLIVKLQQLIGLGMQQVQFGIITPQNLFYMNQELVKAMGFLNTMDFVTDPKLKETVTQFIQMVMMLVQHVQQSDPEMAQAIQPIAQMAQQVMMALGGQQPQETGGDNSKGTQPGQNPATIQEQPAQVINPATEITGGNFFA